MRFGSVCSGIEAASVAWKPLGWEAAWFSEIEPFPSAVLAHHYSDVPNLGDMTTLPARILSGEVEAPDVFCGGTPCQAFSVAGNRKSLDDARGNLSLTFCEIANAIDTIRQQRGEHPAIIFWENVPGCLNTKDNFFGCFLAELSGETVPLQPAGGRWTDAGVVHGPKRTIAWRVLDAQYFGVAQRRRRVFVVASARKGFNPSEVLFEFDGLRRDTAPSREARQGIAGDVARCLTFDRQSSGEYGTAPVASTVSARDYKSASDLVAVCATGNITHTLTAEGFDASEDGTGGGAVAVPVYFGNAEGGAREVPFMTSQNLGGTAGISNQKPLVGVPTYSIRPDVTPKFYEDIAGTIGATDYNDPTCVSTQYTVRRLTPVECERLQGFPDDYTNIPWRKKPESPDGPRYKALGNSWAVPVVRWIGERINNAFHRL